MLKKNAVTLALALFAAAAVFGLSFAGARMGVGVTSRETTADATETVEPAEADLGIAIPGYDEIRLKANETEQAVYFYNPAQNRCFFVISLKIDDMEIYRSEMIPPNAKIESISLSRPLYSGNYSGAVICYSCYDLYTQQELNGAEIPVKLEVK